MVDALVEVKVSRSKDELVYSVDCSSDLTNEELEYYFGGNYQGYLRMETRHLQRTCTKLHRNYQTEINLRCFFKETANPG